MELPEARALLEKAIYSYCDGNAGHDYVVAAVATLESAVRADALAAVVCHDCEVALPFEPILCNSCVRRRNEEGMELDDVSTFDEWNKPCS